MREAWAQTSSLTTPCVQNQIQRQIQDWIQGQAQRERSSDPTGVSETRQVQCWPRQHSQRRQNASGVSRHPINSDASNPECITASHLIVLPRTNFIALPNFDPFWKIFNNKYWVCKLAFQTRLGCSLLSILVRMQSQQLDRGRRKATQTCEQQHIPQDVQEEAEAQVHRQF